MFGDLKTFDIHGKTFAIGQLEILDAKTLTMERREELEEHLKTIHKQEKTDYALIIIKNLSKKEAWILCVDKKTKNLFEKMTQTSYKDDLLFTSRKFNLRKYVRGWLDERLPRQ